MRIRLRHVIGSSSLSLLVFTTAAAQSNLGWTWNKPLVLPSQGDTAAATSSSLRYTQPLFGSRASSSSTSFVRYNRNYGFSSSAATQSSFNPTMPDGSKVLTFADLQRYHEDVIRPMEERMALMIDELRSACAASNQTTANR